MNFICTWCRQEKNAKNHSKNLEVRKAEQYNTLTLQSVIYTDNACCFSSYQHCIMCKSSDEVAYVTVMAFMQSIAYHVAICFLWVVTINKEICLTLSVVHTS